MAAINAVDLELKRVGNILNFNKEATPTHSYCEVKSH